MMAIRLQDIADELNLSKMTISKVLRGQTDVSAETKARVLKKVKELNYRPNISARSLRTGQTHSVGMVVWSLSDPSIGPIVRGINEVFRPAQYSVVLSSVDGDTEMEERELDLHLSRQMDALLIVPGSDTSTPPQVLTTATVPIVYIGQSPPRTAWPSIGLREEEVGQIAVEHLLKRRCKRIAYLRGPRTPIADRRFAGFLDAMRSAGASVKQEWMIDTQPGVAEYQTGFEIMQRLTMGRIRPDGLVAYTDLLGAGAHDGAVSAGLKVPEQLQVIGCGDAAICETGIRLTSVDLVYEETGHRAARLALRCIDDKGEAAPRSVMLSPKIVQRQSTLIS